MSKVQYISSNLLKILPSKLIHVSSKHIANCPPNNLYSMGTAAIVTGSSMGIGLEFVRALLENGLMNIVMSSSKNVKKGEEELNKLRRKYVRSCLCYIKCDTSDCEDVQNLFNSSVELFGNIDLIINNAGIFNENTWSRMIDINMKGVVCGTQLGMNIMSKEKGGKGGTIVNLSSILGLSPMAGAPVYTATKHAVIGLTRSYALPYHYKKSGVRVMAMCPGVTETPLITTAVSAGEGNPLNKEASRELSSLPPQHVCHTGLCLIKMLKEGDTGSIWVTEDKEIYEVCIPDRLTIRKL